MSLVAVVGDLTTTTAVLLAAGWPSVDDPFVVELDPRGGNLAAWLDLPVEPSLSAAVTRAPDGAWPAVAPMVRTGASGVRLLPAPVSPREASRAVAESGPLVTTFATLDAFVAIADLGPLDPSVPVPQAVRFADRVFVVHAQRSGAPRASAVRVQRLAEVWSAVRQAAIDPSAVGLVVVGDDPFDLEEIGGFLGAPRSAQLASLPLDPAAAGVVAGAAGVGARRFERLPLVRATGLLARRSAATVRAGRADRRVEPVAEFEAVRS
jgi:hypothetical protein